MSVEGGGYYPSPPPFPFNFHLLEVTLVSAQDLFPASRSMRTYAAAWINTDHRIRTRVDAVGHTDPTWNQKFVFRVDDATLRSDTSAVHVDIYSARPRFVPGSDTLVGTARAVISTLRPSAVTRFIAVQVRRPFSLRPQGILNIGLALIDAYARSLPLYADLGATNFSNHDLVVESKPAKKAVSTKAAAVRLEKNGSVGGLGDKERVELEKKLKKWRSEIPAMAEDGGVETEVQEGSGRGKPRRPRAISCFNIAGKYVDEIDKDESSGSRRR
ncbi:hypothetical protein KSP39_PZI004262 [Platanthera zijinensis]|uniref:C2 domain-containing protein n=1 Tax=Platanthera zijinensis TaxID=2320716 RepID=A0AAP0GBR3_9ASPA